MQLQHLAVEYHVELRGAVLVSVQAAVLGVIMRVVMFMAVFGREGGQGQ